MKIKYSIPIWLTAKHISQNKKAQQIIFKSIYALHYDVIKLIRRLNNIKYTIYCTRLVLVQWKLGTVISSLRLVKIIRQE